MGTELQEVYDVFMSKLDEDLTGKESLIFTFLKTAISKSYKTVRHSLKYTADTASYDGYFNDVLDQDEIELLSLYMLYENKRRRKEYLEGLKREIGTKDFNQLPDKAKELSVIGISMKDLLEEINEFKNQFNTYKYN